MSEWAIETMLMINKLTPEIKGKASDPDWFLLRQRLEQAQSRTDELTRERDDWHKVADDRSVELNRVMLERDELKAKVAELETLLAHKNNTANVFMAQVKKLQASIAELEKDKARLDWLEKQERRQMVENRSACEEFLVWYPWQHTCWGKTYREAIDAAMQPDAAMERKESTP